MQESRRPWAKEQDNAVIQIVQQIGLKNWPLVSTIMRQRYNITGRSGKQCRQRWHNQLNPEVNKKPWTQQEEKLLFEAHKTYRNRWIDISKLFQGRTDNSIKNHFYSTIRRSLRRICKLLGNKNSTSQLRNIKPSILSKIFEYSQLKGEQVTQQNQQMVKESKIITQELLNFARNKYFKSIQSLQDTKRKNLQLLIEKLNEFSKNYSFQKDSYQFIPLPKSHRIRNPKIIIVKNQFRKLNNQNQWEEAKIVQKQTHSLKNRNKEYLYDWEQFQKRCLFVKQIFQNKTESNQGNSPQQKEDSFDNYLSGENNTMNYFVLEQKDSDKIQTYATTPRSMNRKGFQPFKIQENQMGQQKPNEYQSIVQKLKYEMVNNVSN